MHIPGTISYSVLSPELIRSLIEHSLDADKAIDIVSIDLRGISPLSDSMIIASGTSSRQIVAMAEKLRDRLVAAGARDIRIEGTEGGNWVVLDAGDAIVHLFRPEVRAFYNLEKMWSLSHIPHLMGPSSGAAGAGLSQTERAG